mgnify:CR=1 FL=1|tara:strand:+ start:4724 stop:5509 length:786 start_codon:yes stop_codon:yes gene_type:complete
MAIVVVSGGFDPLHKGHISYFSEAKNLGDKLIVALNSDEWLKNKKGKAFMPFSDRKSVIENLNMVDDVIDFKDDNLGSCSNALVKIKKTYPNEKIIFCNGGDRTEANIPEENIDGVEFRYGVGGKEKINSSSWLIKDYINNSEERIWGKFYTLFNDENVKVKELVIYPGKNLSYQRHKHRSEFWFISKGICKVNYAEDEKEKPKQTTLIKDQIFHVKNNNWHQILNDTVSPCHIIEIQYGEKTIEDDIERKTKENIKNYND